MTATSRHIANLLRYWTKDYGATLSKDTDSYGDCGRVAAETAYRERSHGGVGFGIYANDEALSGFNK